jgi:protein-tyrosine phosphatase
LKVLEPYPGVFVRGRINEHWPEERVLKELNELDVGYVLSVFGGRTPSLERASADGLIRYRHEPLSDGRVIDKPLVNALALEVVEAYANANVLINCRAGRNRSQFIVALTLMNLLNVNGATAISIVRAAKPIALANPWFEAYLRSLPAPG